MRIHGSRAFVTAVLLTLSGIAAVAAQSVQPTLFEETGYFPADVLRESSGIAVSRTTPGLLWTHNDSGDRAMIYATNFEGAILAGSRVRGAEARDWEDISVGPCPKDSEDGSCISSPTPKADPGKCRVSHVGSAFGNHRVRPWISSTSILSFWQAKRQWVGRAALLGWSALQAPELGSRFKQPPSRAHSD